MVSLPLARQDCFNLVKVQPAILRDKDVAGAQATNTTPLSGPWAHQYETSLRRQAAQAPLSCKWIVA